MGQNQVRCVASGAIRGDRQTLLQQRLSMDALGVVLQNIILGNGSVALNGRAFTMALAANERHFQRRHR